MAGITVHTGSPINPNAPPNPLNASQSKSSIRYTPATATPTTTTNHNSYTPPPHPQPGAAAGPQPTTPPRLTDSPSTKTIPAPTTRPLQPTPSSLSKLSIPMHTNSSSPYTAPPIPLHQPHLPLYSSPSFHSTPPASAVHPYHTPPTPFSPPHRQDLSHPPGYVQSRGSFDDRPLSACSTPSPNNRAYYLNSDHKSRLSILDGQYRTEKSTDDDDPLSAGSKWMWETAVKWTKVAGKTLKEGEGEFWRRVNGDTER